jgi:membrane protein DedA with SNARE-associated domain
LNLAALYVYWMIIGWIFITSLGLPPIPEEVAVAGLGAWVHQNPDAFLLFSWLICLGAVLGTDLFLYSIGRLGGCRLLRNKYVQKFLKPERVQTFSRKFQDRGVWFMLTARLIPGWRTAVFITAGSIHYPVSAFVLADAMSSVPLVTFFFFGGYFAADWIKELNNNLHQAQSLILFIAFLAALVVGIVVYLKWMKKHQAEEEAEEAEEHIKMEQEELAVTAQAAGAASAHSEPVRPEAGGNGVHASAGANRPVNTKP